MLQRLQSSGNRKNQPSSSKSTAEIADSGVAAVETAATIAKSAFADFNV